MAILKHYDIPFYWTGGFLHQAYIDLFDKCPGTFDCNDRNCPMMYCSLDGKHLSPKEKAIVACGYLLGFPFAITIDAISLASFPVRFIVRLGKKCN
jgi:hypothetical protein